MAPHAPIEAIRVARTNATVPFTGRVVLMAGLEFTMKPLEENVLVGAMGAECKESLLHGQPPATIFFVVTAPSPQPLPNITLTRRQNVLALFQAFAEKALAAGATPKGLEQSFAATLEISPSMWSQIKSARPIGDKLARQIEAHCDQPAGWLDEARADASPTPTERVFLDLALQAWRATNGAGRKALRAQMKAIAEGDGG